MADVLARFSSLTWALILLFVWAGSGCGKADRYEINVSKDLARAAAAVEKTYATAAPNLKMAAAELASALKAKDYESAVLKLMALRSLPENTDEQLLFLRGVMASLQAQIAEAVDRGDTNASKAVELLKGARF